MKDFFINIFSTNTKESSKRFFGGIGFICSIIFIALWDKQLIETLLFVSASLVGLETLTNIFKRK